MLRLGDEHPVEGVAVNRRQASRRNGVLGSDGQSANPLSLIRSGSPTGSGSFPMACLMATSQIVAALT